MIQSYLIDLNLQSVEHRAAVSHPPDFGDLNPGYVLWAG
jgi:hypothetical protein